MNSAPEKTSVADQAEYAWNSPRAHPATPGRRHRAPTPAPAPEGGSFCLDRTATSASVALTNGTTSSAQRQPTPARAPVIGMPTIQAVGWPASVHDSTRDRDP